MLNYSYNGSDKVNDKSFLLANLFIRCYQLTPKIFNTTPVGVKVYQLLFDFQLGHNELGKVTKFRNALRLFCAFLSRVKEIFFCIS